MVIELAIVAGIGLAAIFTLISVSFTFVLAASGVFNFVHVFIVGFATIVTYEVNVAHHMPFVVAAFSSLAVGAAIGVLTELIGIRALFRRSHNPGEAALVSTLGLMGASIAATTKIFGTVVQLVPSYVSNSPVKLGNIPIRPIYIVMVIVTIVVVVVIDQTLKRTEIGRVFRVTLEDSEGAAVLGQNSRKVIRYAFLIGGALAGLAGAMVAPLISASASGASEFAFFGFVAMAIGGFGSFGGSVVGGVIVGLTYGITGVVFSPSWTGPILLILLVAVLVVRPAGLFGTAGLFGATKGREI